MRTHQNTTNTIEQLKRCLCERTKSKSRGARWLARNEQILWIRKRSQKLKNKNKRSTWIESNECERDKSRCAHEKWFNTMQYIEHSYTRRPICFDVCACVCNHRQTLRHQLHNGIENVVVVCVCFFFIAFMSFSFATVTNRSDELSSPVQKLFICTFKILFGFVCRLFFCCFFLSKHTNWSVSIYSSIVCERPKYTQTFRKKEKKYSLS